MPAAEYTLGNTAASSAPRCESSTSVPMLTTAPTPASAASLTASSGGTSSRKRCVCESTSMPPITSSRSRHRGALYRAPIPAVLQDVPDELPFRPVVRLATGVDPDEGLPDLERRQEPVAVRPPSCSGGHSGGARGQPRPGPH